MENDDIYGNQINENEIEDFNNNQYNEYNNFNEYNQYEQGQEQEQEQDNNIEDGEYFNDNDNEVYLLNEENIKLKNVNKQLLIRNQQLEQNRINLNQKFLKTKELINRYKLHFQKTQNELNDTKNKYYNALKEIKTKNTIISDLKNGVDIKDINMDQYNKNESDEKILLSINDQIKNIQKEFFEEENVELEQNNNNNINEDLQNSDKNNLVQLVTNNINIFAEKLNDYKNKIMKEIVNLRNIIDSNQSDIVTINEQSYLNLINIIKNVNSSMAKPGTTWNFPNFSLNDDNNTKINNIFITIKILADYIIMNNQKNKNKNNNSNILNEELKKKCKEMSEMLLESNETLKKTKKSQNELKERYNLLEQKYNEVINNNKNKIDNDKDYEKLMDDLNKKDQQIKSLEHMVTRLTKQVNENNNNNNNNEEELKINDNKINFVNNNNFCYEENNFVKNEKKEKNLKKFLDKFTNGEYGNNFIKKNPDINNLKEELEKLSKRINAELESNTNV